MKTPEKAYMEMINEATKAAKATDKKFNAEEHSQMYSVLQDVVIDSMNITSKLIKDWEFTGVKYKTNTVTGNTSVHTFTTPDGEFKVKVTAELI